MGYVGLYSLGARCGSEAIATGLMIFLGEGTMANELLSKTKGHSMGFGWVAFGFGNAFFASLIMLSHISAHMNPGYCAGLWLIGQLDAEDFFALSAAEFGGAIIGAFLVWLYYLPHFKTLPEPPALSPEDRLLRSRDAVSDSTLAISSYDTRSRRDIPASQKVKDALKDIRYYFAQPNEVHDVVHASMVEQALGRESLIGTEASLRRRSLWVLPSQLTLARQFLQTSIDPEACLRRRSVQVCDMHARLKKLQSLKSLQREGDLEAGGPHHKVPGRAHPIGNGVSSLFPPEPLTLHAAHSAASMLKDPGDRQPEMSLAEHQEKRLDALYKAAITADQNAKLSVFCTRPGIRSPFFNWLTEFLATLALVLGVLLIDARGEEMTGEFALLWGPLKAFFIGLYAVVLILALGGPTGIAMNPARDLGPRIVHWALPIPGKGSSEWGYSWIPVTAGFVGGVAGAALYRGVNEITLHTMA